MKRPKLVVEYFDSAGKIDIHNHLWQPWRKPGV